MKMRIAAMLVTLALSSVASAQSVSYNFDRGTTFAKFKTFRWVQVGGADKLDQLTNQQLTSALEAELAKKGLTKVDTDTAELYVDYQVGITNQQQINMYGTGAGWRFGGGMATATTSTLTIGSVSLDIYDSANKQLVWRGVATKTIDTGASPDKRQKNIQSAAAKLLKNYPPPMPK